MNDSNYYLPKKYWVYLSLVVVCAILLFANIFRTDSWTVEKEFAYFTQRDWLLFAVFITEELLVGFIMFFFSFKARKVLLGRDAKIQARFEVLKYAGIEAEEYEFIWFDYSNTERALIKKQDSIYQLHVDEYDERTELWCSVDSVSIFDNLSDLKKSLYYDYDFFCDENAELDKYGDEVYIEK